VLLQAQGLGQAGCGNQFLLMALAIVERQADHPIACFDRQGRGCG